MEKTNEKGRKKCLRAYYASLPANYAPKNELIEAISTRCGVTQTTARNWCLYGIKPREYKHLKILSELTGLSEDELFED